MRIMGDEMRLLFVVPNWRWCEEEKNVNYPYPPYNLCLLAAIVREQCEKSGNR